ncbi:MAG TPA: YfiR family protein [Desulfobulbaceae bacterium]|nr:YfiR family protein [Desulfobulbaceae bacterium]
MKLPAFPIIIAIIILLTVKLGATVAQAEVGNEYVVKAAMVRNFAKFTHWPENSPAKDGNATMTVCLMGDESLLESFAGIRGKTVEGRTIELKWIDNLTGLTDCDLLFVNRESRANMARIMEAVGNRPILTIGETREFTRAGGMITFFLNKGRIRFRINPEAARHSGLKLSSSLLELATIVHQHSSKQIQ